MDAARIERSVEDTIRTAQYTIADRSVDVIHIAKNLGFLVGNAILNDEDDGFIVVEEGKDEIMGIKTDKLIGVNSDRPLEWKRFIIAHELGHYVLHYKEKNLTGLYAHRDHKRGHNELENEAEVGNRLLSSQLVYQMLGFRTGIKLVLYFVILFSLSHS